MPLTPHQPRSSLRAGHTSAGYNSAGYNSAGYTMVEVMMALAVLAIGSVGIISLQKVTVMGGLNARNLTSATDAASGWVNAMQAEASLWNDASNGDISDMPTVNAALTAGSWYSIPTATFPNGGGTVADDTTNIIYCSQIRVTYVGPGPQTGVGATDTLRLEVRTFFARDGHPINAECVGGSALTGGELDTILGADDGTAGTPAHFRHEYGFVFVTSMLRRNST